MRVDESRRNYTASKRLPPCRADATRRHDAAPGNPHLSLGSGPAEPVNHSAVAEDQGSVRFLGEGLTHARLPGHAVPLDCLAIQVHAEARSLWDRDLTIYQLLGPAYRDDRKVLA